MLPGRHLLYHRGIDDHAGTYITDYIFSGVCFLLCLQLLLRIRKEKKEQSEEEAIVASCCRINNWLPWNWPQCFPTAVTMSTYGVLLVGISNMMLSLLGGLAHQFVQTVEAPSDHHSHFFGWLIVWRFAASFSAVLFLGLLIIMEQLIVQEAMLPIRLCVRRVYYITVFLVFVAFLLYNFHPLIKDNDDPFSIGKSFMVCFAVMFLYGICTIALLIKYYCCCCRKCSDRRSTVGYSPGHNAGHKSPVEASPKSNFYDCCKSVAGGYHDNIETVSSRSLEMILTASAPWLYLVAGAVNFLLKRTCADSDDAAAELDCPLPNWFNHNALLHVIQILSLICFFVAENISMTRRSLLCTDPCIKRTRTSSTIYNEGITSCTASTDDVTDDGSPLKHSMYLNNNHKPLSSREDFVCEMEETVVEIVSAAQESDVTVLPKFPAVLHEETETVSSNYRASVYDNVIQQTV